MKSINAVLYIIGDGPLKHDIQKQIKKYHLEQKIILLGRQKNPYAFLKSADCFVFGSHYEGFPNVLLEALACGLPIISTDCYSGPREILAPKTPFKKQLKNDIECAEFGILTPVDDVQNMTKAMQLMMKDKNLRERYIHNSQKRAADFDAQNITPQWVSVINEVLNQ